MNLNEIVHANVLEGWIFLSLGKRVWWLAAVNRTCYG